MTKSEFEDYLKSMNLGKDDTPEKRLKLVDMLIDKKLILQEAEKEGLHKQREFLRTLEMFYEQLLFKAILDRKIKEIATKIKVTDDEVRQRYRQLKEKGVIEKELDEVYDEIKWQIFKEKQSKALDKWVKELREKADIEIKENEILK
jgi:DNA-binding transcriptional ArsR family regulator